MPGTLAPPGFTRDEFEIVWLPSKDHWDVPFDVRRDEPFVVTGDYNADPLDGGSPDAAGRTRSSDHRLVWVDLAVP